VGLHANLFAQNDGVGADYVNRLRATDSAARAAGAQALGVFNLRGISPGKGSICGIAVVRELLAQCTANHIPLLIWPILQLLPNGMVAEVEIEAPLENTPPGCLVIAESYPKWYWRQCGQSLDDYELPTTWDAVRLNFANNAAPAVLPCSKDRADALIAWYGMAQNADIAQTLAPTEAMLAVNAASPDVIRNEGWIIGV
jgi:hypothetical protein